MKIKNILLEGDCIERMEELEANSVDTVASDFIPFINQEILSEYAKDIKDPITRIKILLGIKGGKFKEYKFEFQKKNNIFSSESLKNIIITNFNNDKVEERPYKLSHSIFAKMKVKYVLGKQFLDFEVLSTNSRKAVYSLMLVRVAKYLLNNHKDIMLSIPKIDGNLKISSKSQDLKILITPKYIMR